MPRKQIYFIPAFVIVFILFFTVSGRNGLLRIHQLNREIQGIQHRIEMLKAENENLKREIEALHKDRRYKERIARDSGFGRKNEMIYQFPAAVKHEQPEAISFTPLKSH